MIFKKLFLVAGLIAATSSVYADDSIDVWHAFYQNESLFETKSSLDVSLAVSHFVYHKVETEIKQLSKNLKCHDIDIKDENFSAHNCVFNEELKQDIYGRLLKKNGENLEYIQVYAVGPDASKEETITEINHLLQEDPISNPRDEWLVSHNDQEEKTNQFFENRRVGATIALSASAYLGTKKENVKSLAKLFLCSMIDQVDSGVNLSNCQTYRYYEIRDLEYPYYLVSSVGVDFLNNKNVMDKFHELEQLALAQLAIQIKERKSQGVE